MKTRIDASARTFLMVCDCGWRELALSRPDAHEAARRHELRAHTGDRNTVSGAQRHADTAR